MSFKKWIGVYFYFAMVSAGFSLSAHAAEKTQAFLMKGNRPLGMGGAFIAMKGSDENALFYNPASIHDYEDKLHAQFLSGNYAFGYKSIDFIGELRDLSGDLGDEDDDAQKTRIFGDFTEKNFGRVEHYRASIPIALFMHRYFSVGLIADSESRVDVRDPSFDSFDLKTRNDSGVVAGTAWGWCDNAVEAGVAVKGLYRVFTSEIFTQRDVVVHDDFSDAYDLKTGFGVGVDLGVKFTPPIKLAAIETLKPTFGLTYQDIGNTRFIGEVDDTAQSLSLGLAIHPQLGPVETSLALDFRDLNHDLYWTRHLYGGWEFRFPEVVKTRASLRVGAHHGYIAGGFTLDWRYVRLTAVTYSEEIGEMERVKESRLFGAQLAFGF